jgi:hypothetical protein
VKLTELLPKSATAHLREFLGREYIIDGQDLPEHMRGPQYFDEGKDKVLEWNRTHNPEDHVKLMRLVQRGNQSSASTAE